MQAPFNIQTNITVRYITKIIWIPIDRAERRIRIKLGQKQSSFIEDTGTRNVIVMHKMITKTARQMQKHVNLRFIDEAKTFDKVHHKELLETTKWDWIILERYQDAQMILENKLLPYG